MTGSEYLMAVLSIYITFISLKQFPDRRNAVAALLYN